MPYVQYDSAGAITGLFANPQPSASTFLPDTDPTVVAFLANGTNTSSVSRRQFYEQLAVQGLITQAEALAGADGSALPASIATLLGTLPAAQQFDAKMKLLTAESFQISNALVPALAANYGWTPSQTQAFWNAAAALV